MDTIAVLEALRSHWPTRSEDHNREYLEKLFQATIRVPAPRKTSAYHLVEQQLNEHHIPNAAIWAIQLVDLIEPNPRKLKNFTNSLCAVWSMHRLIATREDDQTIRRLILFQYLSLYHPAVWRILERQPWALQILRAVLMGNTQEALSLPTGYSRADQRMMESYFSRSFAHILRHNSNDPSKDEKHRGVEMEKAVELFLERIDRKRSDEVFARLAQATFTNEDAVDECFLSIVAAQANGANP
jgi:transcription termination factor NusB